MSRRGLRPVLALLALVLGGFLSLCAIAVHGYAWGLVLGLATAAALLVALPPGWWSRLSFALGWSAVIALASGQRAEGDYVIASDVNGYLLLASGVVVFLAGLTGLVRRPRADDSGGVDAAP